MKSKYITLAISLFIATITLAQNPTTYQYDNDNRIISSDDGTKIQTYTYDKLGNRTTYTRNSTASNAVDLSVSNLNIPSTTLEQGQTYTVSCTVHNLGTSTVAGSTLKVYLATTDTGTETEVGSFTVGSIAASDTENANFNITVPATANVGSQYLVFFADATESITETDETNNKNNVSVTVTASSLAELHFQNTSANPLTIQAGNSISLAADVLNTGNADATNFTVIPYLSLNATYEANDISLTDAIQNYTLLNGNGTTTYSKSALIPSNTVGGTYYILFVLDIDNTVLETDETNNLIATQITVTNGGSSSPASNFIANNTTATLGSPVTFIDQSTNSPTSWLWTFEGGTPSTSTQQNPEVTYTTLGSFDVTLVATNASGSDTENRVDYITTDACQGVWSNVGIDGFSAGGTGNIKMQIDSSGIPYVAFIDQANSNMATVMKYNGTNWVLVGNAGLSGVRVNYLDLKIANDNTPYIAYVNYNPDRKVTVKKFNGTSWINVGSPNFTNRVIGSPSLAISNTNQPYVAFQERDNNGRLAVMKFQSNSWVNVGSPGISVGSVGNDYQSFEIDKNNNIYLAYEDLTNGEKMAVKKFNGSSWINHGAAGISAGASAYPSLDFDNSDNVYLTYTDFANGQKTTVMKNTNGLWNTIGSAGFSPEGKTILPTIVISNEVAYVSFSYEASDNARATSVMKFDGSNWVSVGDANIIGSQLAVFQTIDVDINGDPYFAYINLSNANKLSVLKYTCDTSITADFYADTTEGIIGQSITFTEASTNNPTSWSWAFTPSTVTYLNGTSSTSQHPEVSFDNAGTYTVALTASNTDSSDDESKVDYITVTECVSACSSITITADAQTKVYSEADPSLTYQITAGSLESGDVLSGILSRATGEDVGDYAITSTLSNDKYDITFISADVSITEKPITITADAQTKMYGETDPSLTYQITSGSLESVDMLSGALSRAIGEDVGDYAITSSLSNSNYNITFVSAIFTITTTLGLEDFDNIKINIYPNPTKRYIFLEINKNLYIKSIEVFSLLGEKLLSISKDSEVIDLSKFANGTYLIKIKTDKGTITKKVLKE